MKPPYLQNGDTVGLICTARKVTTAEIASAISTIKQWGFQVVLGESIGAADNQFGGSDALRAHDLQMMLDSPRIKAIIVARGGYGTVRIVDQINWDGFIKHPKWIVGFSDVTVLHCHVYRHLGVPTIHASMPLSFANNTPEALGSIRRALTGGDLLYQWQGSDLNRIGTAEGTLVGGNLSLLYSLAGTPSDIDTEGKILFIEDLDEYLYHIDRMLMQLKRSGKLAKLAGLIVGGMTDMKDNVMPFGKTAEAMIAEHTAGHQYPIGIHFPAGHIPDNRALILGAKVQLTIHKGGCKLVW